MKAQQDHLLEACHTDFLNVCFSDYPMEKINTKISQKITGFGTNINEKIESYADFIALLQMQRDESIGLDMAFSFYPVSKTVLANGTAAVFIDEIKLKMVIEGNSLELNVRISSVYEWDADQWWGVHFHGSIPQGIDGESDTWTVNEWKEKNDDLEKIILERTNELRESLENLKATQAQLIQSEKMASLGELTAGIAHEIQNPLNFVNNFSEVSNELIDELKESRAKSQEASTKTEADEIEDEILTDIKQNLEKINHHGKRADAIVKGMLQHSRTNSAEKELTDINKLADEYLRLAYHGLRAKDKNFNATLETDYDESIGKISVIPQDIGRVILNLITNAFYAAPLPPEGGFKDSEYIHNPTIWVSTKRTSDSVIISVRDNGPGIPKHILDKIFQPFFTTKPTGQGTGLGLSLAYDIVKAHGGELKVETKENIGTEFIISIARNE